MDAAILTEPGPAHGQLTQGLLVTLQPLALGSTLAQAEQFLYCSSSAWALHQLRFCAAQHLLIPPYCFNALNTKARNNNGNLHSPWLWCILLHYWNYIKIQAFQAKKKSITQSCERAASLKNNRMITICNDQETYDAPSTSIITSKTRSLFWRCFSALNLQMQKCWIFRILGLKLWTDDISSELKTRGRFEVRPSPSSALISIAGEKTLAIKPSCS